MYQPRKLPQKLLHHGIEARLVFDQGFDQGALSLTLRSKLRVCACLKQSRAAARARQRCTQRQLHMNLIVACDYLYNILVVLQPT